MRAGSLFLFGMMLLVVGATLAIGFVVDLRLPMLQSVIALLLILWGSHLVGNPAIRRGRRTA